jgi:hypothetical protein
MHHRESLWIIGITKSEEYYVSDSPSVRRTLIKLIKEIRYISFKSRYPKELHAIFRRNPGGIAKASVASIADLSCEGDPT